MTSVEHSDRLAITGLIEAYRQGFLDLDPKRLASIWDQEHDPLVYVAQEKAEPIHGWPAIESYFAALPSHLDRMLGMELEHTSIDMLGETALAFFIFRARAVLKGRPGSHEPTGRVTMIFRKGNAGWRVIHYHESALAAQAAAVKS